MKHVELASVKRVLRQPVAALKRWWQKPGRRAEFIERGFFVLIALLCGFIIANTHIVSAVIDFFTPDPAAPTSTQQSVGVSMTPTHSSGSRLFASQPSWVQDFSYSTSGMPDSKYWNVLVGPALNSNKEQQYYTDNAANVRIEDGALRLIATNSTHPGGYRYGSARLETEGKISFLYGRFDIVTKLPSGVGTWPAVWLLPANNTYASHGSNSDLMRHKNGGEIDIIEAVGFEPNMNYAVAHTASDLLLRQDGTGSHRKVHVPHSATEFHTYSLLWTPTSLTFEVDGIAYYTYRRQSGADYKTWPFDQPFYLIANLAIGGTWGGMDKSRFPSGIDNAALPTSLDIKSIKYYPYVGSTAIE